MEQSILMSLVLLMMLLTIVILSIISGLLFRYILNERDGIGGWVGRRVYYITTQLDPFERMKVMVIICEVMVV